MGSLAAAITHNSRPTALTIIMHSTYSYTHSRAYTLHAQQRSTTFCAGLGDTFCSMERAPSMARDVPLFMQRHHPFTW